MKNKAYGELALHPAPLCVFTFPILLLSFVLPEQHMEKASKALSYFMYWLENFFFIIFHSFFLAILLPFVYLKNLFVVLSASHGLFTTLFNTLGWLIFGPLLTIFLGLRDVYYYIKILSMHRGCREEQGLEDELKSEQVDE